MSGLETLAADSTGFRIARTHPGPCGGCQSRLMYHFLFVGPWLLPLSLVALWMGALFPFSFSPPPLLPFLLLTNSTRLQPLLLLLSLLSDLFLNQYLNLTIWRQLVFFLPSLSRPSPLLCSVTVASQMFFLSLPAGGGLIGRGAWGREGGTAPFSLGRFLPLLGFLPICFGLTG